MTQTWVYILQAVGGWFYVGTTNRLFTRMKEHLERNGAKATSKFFYGTLVGLYKLGDKEEVTDRIDVENLITLQLMKLQENPVKVRGGNYCVHGLDDREWNLPKEKLKNCKMPVICNCNLPAYKFTSKRGEMFYKCALSCAEWIDKKNFPINISEECDFFKSFQYAKPEKEPNYCLVCSLPCGDYIKCYYCNYKNSHRQLNDIEICSSEEFAEMTVG